MMRRKNKAAVAPPEVQKVQSRFAAWRKTKKGRDRIPDRLWSAAVRLCRRHSVEEASRWLRLNHSALRDRVGAEKGERKVRRSRSVPTFVELVPSSASSSAEYVIEVEGTEGKRMRVRLRGASVTEVAALARSLREEAR